jgi:serine protease Do/serine protease DegQ
VGKGIGPVLGGGEIRTSGSGVVFDARRGFIVTNSHLIDHADEITVKLIDGRAMPARRVGADPETDVAVIQVRADGLTDPFGNSDRLEVGDFVFAICNPQRIGQTVTAIRLALLRTGKIAEFAVSRLGSTLTLRAEMTEREPAARSR